MKNHQPLISIIIPVYNLENHILACLQSLEKQTAAKNNFEVLIIDDASTDKTKTKLKNYHGPLPLKIFSLQKNSGPGIARNKGIDEASGIYILFLDGDDFLVEDAVEKLIQTIKKKKADLITFDWTYLSDVQPNQPYLARRRDLESMPDAKEDLIPHYLAMNMDGSVIYTLAKKEIFTQYNIRFDGGFHEDMAVIFKMYYGASQIYKLSEVIYIKQNRGDSIVNTLSPKHVEGYLQAWPQILSFLEEHEGKKALQKYKNDYWRGMSGHIATLITKNIAVNKASVRERKKIYESIFKCLKKDEIVNQTNLSKYDFASKKDKITEIFLATSLKNQKDIFQLEEKLTQID